MPIDEPYWWYGPRWTWQAVALTPASAVYGRLARKRLAKPPQYVSKLPVICVGNFTAGGTGKTPLSITLAEIVQDLGREPVFLTRGYGGSAQGPLLVDAHHATAAETGDEPLLLARAAPTMVARDRVAGVLAIEKNFSSRAVVIMDDGLQNPALAKSFSIAVVDVRRRFGNRFCLPGGPLRAPLDAQVSRVDAILLNGEASDAAERQARSEIGALYSGLVLRSHVAPAGDLKWLSGANVLPFAGIANPSRFFELLEAQGARIAARRTYPDHHTFTDAEAADLLKSAHALKARLVTTEKDFVRLYGMTGKRGELRDMTMTIPVTMIFSQGDHAVLEDRLRTLLEKEQPR